MYVKGISRAVNSSNTRGSFTNPAAEGKVPLDTIDVVLVGFTQCFVDLAASRVAGRVRKSDCNVMRYVACRARFVSTYDVRGAHAKVAITARAKSSEPVLEPAISPRSAPI